VRRTTGIGGFWLFPAYKELDMASFSLNSYATSAKVTGVTG